MFGNRGEPVQFLDRLRTKQITLRVHHKHLPGSRQQQPGQPSSPARVGQAVQDHVVCMW